MIDTRQQFNPNLQKGAVLVISLMILLTMTVLALSSASISSTTELIAANSQEIQYSFQIAESAASKALGETTWINKTIGLASSGSVTSWPSYNIAFNDSGASAEITLSAYYDILNGFTLTSNSDINYLRMQTDTLSNINNTKTDLTHGYARLVAGEN